jgi:hypothetical protein
MPDLNYIHRASERIARSGCEMHVRHGNGSDERKLHDIGMRGSSDLVEPRESLMIVEVQYIHLSIDENRSREKMLEHRLIVLKCNVSRFNADLEENWWSAESAEGVAHEMNVRSGD